MQPPVSDKDRVWHRKEFPKLPVLKVLKRPEGKQLSNSQFVELWLWNEAFLTLRVRSACVLCVHIAIFSQLLKKGDFLQTSYWKWLMF